MATVPAVGDQITAEWGASASRVPLLAYQDAGLATSGTANALTTALRTITNPYGTGVPYRAKCTYYLGFVSAAAGVTGRASITVNGTTTMWATINTLSSAAPCVIVDMPAGGTVTFQGALINLSATMATSNDATHHVMLTEVSPL